MLVNSRNFGVPVEESDSGSTWLHRPSHEIEGRCMASVGIPLANFTVGSRTGSPKQPEGHWEEGKNVQDSGRDVVQSMSEKYVVLISSNLFFSKILNYDICVHTHAEYFANHGHPSYLPHWL